MSDILNAIIQDVDNLNNGKPVSNNATNLPSLPKAKPLAYALFNNYHSANVNENSSIEERRYAYIEYTKLKSKLKKAYVEPTPIAPHCKLSVFHKARYDKAAYEDAKELPLSEQITKPTAMPVEISSLSELKEFFDRIAESIPANPEHVDSIGTYEKYIRGAYYTDGRIDLCKQVVGPTHIAELMRSFRMNQNVKHFLLGNNIIGPTGAKEIADFILDPNKKSNIETWYIAGNDIDSVGMTLIANALSKDPYCKDLWLKRNPIGPDGAKAIAEMLKTNTSIITLDLVNTAILDSGCIAIFDALKNNTSLKSIYLDANGLTYKSAHAIADYIRYRAKVNTEGLTHLSIGINRLGDQGAQIICDALRETWYPLECLVLSSNRIELDGLCSILDYAQSTPSLKVLDIGYYKATADMGELPNSFGNEGARLLARFILLNTPLKYLGFHNTHITSLDIIEAVMPFNSNLISVSAEQFKLSSKKINDLCLRNSGLPLSKHKELARKLKHGINIQVIDSIYRNAD